MAELGDIRKEENGSYSICTTIAGGSETWEPLATYLVMHRVLSSPIGEIVDRTLTVSDELRREGWIPPWETS